MRERGLVVVAAIVLATLATAGVFLYVNNVRKEARTGGELVTVVVSTQDIPVGTDLNPLIDQGVFKDAQVPTDVRVAGGVTNVSQLRNKVTAQPILAGEQIPVARLQGSSQQLPGGILGIPKGFVGFSVVLERPASVGGDVKQGDHVTVYAFSSDVPVGHGNNATTSPVSTTIVPDAQVLKAIDADPASKDATKEYVVTLSLSPADAQKVLLAEELGVVWLGLIPPNELGVANKAVLPAGVFR